MYNKHSATKSDTHTHTKEIVWPHNWNFSLVFWKGFLIKGCLQGGFVNILLLHNLSISFCFAIFLTSLAKLLTLVSTSICAPHVLIDNSIRGVFSLDQNKTCCSTPVNAAAFMRGRPLVESAEPTASPGGPVASSQVARDNKRDDEFLLMEMTRLLLLLLLSSHLPAVVVLLLCSLWQLWPVCHCLVGCVCWSKVFLHNSEFEGQVVCSFHITAGNSNNLTAALHQGISTGAQLALWLF